MLFNSLSFAIFLPIVFLLYWLVPKKMQWGVLFISSYYFYMSWNVKYVVLILFTTIISYITALFVEKEVKQKKKKLYVTIAIVASLGVLFCFKYFNFCSNSLAVLLERISIKYDPIMLNVLLPVGISFYTFQTLSYVIDVYRGKVQAEHHFGKYATFISFFPQLVAGPIERTENLLGQIKVEHSFNYSKATYGMKLMAWGFFKKLVIADVLAGYVDKIYNNIYNYQGFVLVLATVFFAFQIYCDFSGYSDIAIGCAKLLDIDLMTNFKSPYLSSSIKEFWSRWHISLSTWFRDYVYIPLGGNRGSKLRHYRNLIITFLVSGLWHGANWTFVIWGGIHGVAQVVENIVFGKNLQRKGIKWLFSVIFVFGFCSFALMIFRANQLADVGYILTNVFVGFEDFLQYIKLGVNAMEIEKINQVSIAISIIVLLLYDFFALKTDVILWVSGLKKGIRYGIYMLLLFVILYFRASGEAVFVYFQF